MKPIVIIKETNKDGKFELTEKELKELIEQAYKQGFEDGKAPNIIETDEDTDIEYEPIEEVKAQRPDVDNAHVIAAELAKQLDNKDDVIAVFKDKRDDVLFTDQMHDFDAVREIKETYPQRLTFVLPAQPTEKVRLNRENGESISMIYDAEQDISITFRDAYNRLADIEDIIYGEGDEK